MNTTPPTIPRFTIDTTPPTILTSDFPNLSPSPGPLPQTENTNFFDISESPTALKLHPSTVINDFLLQMKPDARIAISEDWDWISVLKQGDLSSPAPEKILTHLLTTHEVSETDGVAYLSPKYSPVVTKEQLPETISTVQTPSERTTGPPSKASKLSGINTMLPLHLWPAVPITSEKERMKAKNDDDDLEEEGEGAANTNAKKDTFASTEIDSAKVVQFSLMVTNHAPSSMYAYDAGSPQTLPAPANVATYPGFYRDGHPTSLDGIGNVSNSVMSNTDNDISVKSHQGEPRRRRKASGI
ncbi:hypothetical protein BDZ97DRAFT_1923848 [Flammula alnicola]|nr:hypothetical protein BDZ97DRAFT_1923848 [Flammula alnicola]